MARPRWMRSAYALPAEHGAWALWLGPLAVGLGAGGWNGRASLCLVAAQTAAFLSRHPFVLLAKTAAGRRHAADRWPAVLWFCAYGALALGCGLGAIAMGYPLLWWVVLPLVPMALWQAWLVRHRVERQMTIELAGSGVLALAAPAAWYVGRGSAGVPALLLWGLCWFQAAAAIVYVYLRLAQRRLTTAPPRLHRIAMGWRALLYAAFNLAASIALAAYSLVPPLVPLAFGAMLFQVCAGVAAPAVGGRPGRIGLEQVCATAAFSGLLILAYSL